MREDTGVQLRQPGTFSEDALTEILRLGARRLLAQAVEIEVTAFVEGHADLADPLESEVDIELARCASSPLSITASDNTYRDIGAIPESW